MSRNYNDNPGFWVTKELEIAAGFIRESIKKNGGPSDDQVTRCYDAARILVHRARSGHESQPERPKPPPTPVPSAGITRKCP